MSERIDGDEAMGRARIAAAAYEDWPTGELWEEFTLLTDESWEGRETADGPLQEPWAKREAIGLALIGRGVTAAELERGMPDGGVR